MLRVLLTYVLPLIAPTLIYLLWRLWRIRRGGPASAPAADVWKDAPWVRLMAAGTGLLVTVLVIAALTGGSPAGDDYQPPRLEDGRVVPGQTQPGESPPRESPPRESPP